MDFQGDWVWLSTERMTVGLLIRDGKIALAPPIARWAIGKDEHVVAAWFKKHGADFARLM